MKEIFIRWETGIGDLVTESSVSVLRFGKTVRFALALAFRQDFQALLLMEAMRGHDVWGLGGTILSVGYFVCD